MTSDMNAVEIVGLIIGFAVLLRVLVAWEDWEDARREQDWARGSLRDAYKEFDPVEYECPKCRTVYFEPGYCDWCVDAERCGVTLRRNEKSATSVANLVDAVKTRATLD